jgi:hypothetical protein
MEAPSLTADGRGLLLLKSRAQMDTYIGQLGDRGTRLAAVRRLTHDQGNNIPTSWARDGAAVLLMSDRNGTYDVFTQDIGDGTAEPLILGQENEGRAFYGKTDSQIFYWLWPVSEGLAPTSARLMWRPGGGLESKQVLAAVPGMVSVKCLPGASRPCMAVFLDPQRKELVVNTLDPLAGQLTELGRLPIDPAGGFSGDISPDGTTIAFAVHGNGIRFVRLADRAVRDVPVKDWADGIRAIAWSSDGTRVFAIWTASNSSTILSVGLGGDARAIWQTTQTTLGDPIPSPDGRYIAFEGQTLDRNAYLVENPDFP